LETQIEEFAIILSYHNRRITCVLSYVGEYSRVYVRVCSDCHTCCLHVLFCFDRWVRYYLRSTSPTSGPFPSFTASLTRVPIRRWLIVLGVKWNDSGYVLNWVRLITNTFIII